MEKNWMSGMPQIGRPGRVVYSEERSRSAWLRLTVRGEIDDDMLSSLETFIQHQRKRMADKAAQPSAETNPAA